MSVLLRMTAKFAALIATDLQRPHGFASERVGFVFGKTARAGDDWLVFPVEYMPVQSRDYIDDPMVGAKIGTAAIRAALQRTLESSTSCFHVHLHPEELPGFGALDLSEQEKLMPSFTAISPSRPHGALVLYQGGAAARAWLPGSATPEYAVFVSLVGYPLQLSTRDP